MFAGVLFVDSLQEELSQLDQLRESFKQQKSSGIRGRRTDSDLETEQLISFQDWKQDMPLLRATVTWPPIHCHNTANETNEWMNDRKELLGAKSYVWFNWYNTNWLFW